MPIKNRIADLHDEIVGWRRHIHTHPELGFEEHETAKFVEARLREFGVDEIVTGIATTGLVAVIKGRTDRSGRVIGLRADMDALPITEATGVDYASVNPGVMHACGHDGHTSMLLGAVKYLAETRNFDGTVVAVFQPAEEGGGGGRVMVEEGVMERWGVQEVYGMHNAPGLPAGEFFIRPGALLASADQFDITIEGVGGHAAAPHEAQDSNLAAAHVMVALQSIASRNVDPLKQVVVSVCTIRSDTDSYNVLPQTVALRGTIRALDQDVRETAATRLHKIVAATAEAYGCTAQIDFEWGYPITINHETETLHASDAAEAVAGKVMRDVPPIMAGEDFAYMLEARPGAYMFIGNGDGAHVHHPAYNFNDEIIPAGVSWFAELVEQRMPVA